MLATASATRALRGPTTPTRAGSGCNECCIERATSPAGSLEPLFTRGGASLAELLDTAKLDYQMAERQNSHTIQAERQYEARSTESFNRIAFAMSVLRVLKPALRVAVFARSRQLSIERGRGLGEEGPWALMGVPPHATRESIVRAVAELSGLESEPFLVDLLCAIPVPHRN